MTTQEIEAYWLARETAYLATLPPRQPQNVTDWAAPYEECSPVLQRELMVIAAALTEDLD